MLVINQKDIKRKIYWIFTDAEDFIESYFFGYNISVILRKKTINILKEISYDAGDIEKLRRYFPPQLVYTRTKIDMIFDGGIWNINWTIPKYTLTELKVMRR